MKFHALFPMWVEALENREREDAASWSAGVMRLFSALLVCFRFVVNTAKHDEQISLISASALWQWLEHVL